MSIQKLQHVSFHPNPILMAIFSCGYSIWFSLIFIFVVVVVHFVGMVSDILKWTPRFLGPVYTYTIYANTNAGTAVKGFCRCHQGLPLTDLNIKRVQECPWPQGLSPFKAESFLQLAVKKKARGSEYWTRHCGLKDGRGYMAKNAKGQEKLRADWQQGDGGPSPQS